MATEGKPTMEAAIAGFQDFRTGVLDLLDSEFSQAGWSEVEDAGYVRSSCDATSDVQGEEVRLPLVSAAGVLPLEAWDKAFDEVARIAAEHGFGAIKRVIDRPGDVQIYGTDEFGGHFYYGMAANSTLAMTTGCHAWAGEPSV